MLMFNSCSKDEETNKDDDEKLKSVTLTFDKLVLDNATVTVADLLAQIKEEEKAGFAIKSLSFQRCQYFISLWESTQLPTDRKKIRRGYPDHGTL